MAEIGQRSIELECRPYQSHRSDMAKPALQSARGKVISRLEMYWKMEGANIALVPLAMLFLSGGKIGIASVIAIVPMMALLAIGTIYWRAKLHHIEHGISPDGTISTLAKLDLPMAICSVASVLAAVAAWSFEGVAVGTEERWVATAAAVFTVLEYINYYHRQLQHFDHLPDWKRLISGAGFRKSQLRQDIERLQITARNSPDQQPR
ncbi:hypothetical protein [Erythrobacter crassostreae]|uniref:Uncharacterized protein n=1 Tax=Erythrobacter crassostreae TaxID=2828328 RepID=A0A9X1F3W3_9SPHN|nr:hypothetical protein [Erythrobacter crassostrea]MBV7258843.1 hypothetical protein [Erythrobacter crassostrea]